MGQPNPTQTVTNPRIAKLIELETAGRIKPEHQTELDTYRAQGWAPKKVKSAAAESTEGERKAGAFLTRALGAEKSYLETGVGPRSLIGQSIKDSHPDLLNALPGFIGNSPERQVADTNQDEFIAATLRQDSGAAIPPDEMERQRRIYFPMPNDGPEVIEAKRQARQRAIEGLVASSGTMASDDQRKAFEGIKAWTPQQGGDQKKQEMLGTLVPTDVANKIEQTQLSDEQATAYDAFMKANPTATPEQIRAFASSINMNLQNAEDIVKARDQGGGFVPGKAGVVRPPDISDVRGKDDFGEGADAAVRGAADTLSLSFADEISAAGKTVFGGGTMDDNLRRERAIDAYDAEFSPWLRGGGQLAGGLLFPIGRGATTPGELAKIGGITGAGYGFGSGETMGERVTGGVLGAGSGTALGYGAGKLFERLSRGGRGPNGGGALARDLTEGAADQGLDALPIGGSGDMRDVAARLNIRPSPATVGGKLAEGTQIGLGNLPGSMGPVRSGVEKEIDSLAGAARETAGRMGQVGTPQHAGEIIARGAKVADRAQAREAGRSYRARTEMMGGDNAPVTMGGSRAAVANIENDFRSNEVVGEMLTHPLIKKIIAADASELTLNESTELLSEARRVLNRARQSKQPGRLIGQLRDLEGAIEGDVMRAAQASDAIAGRAAGEGAAAAQQKGDSLWADRMDAQRKELKKALGSASDNVNVSSESVYRQMFGDMAEEGGNLVRLRRTLDRLPKRARDTFSATAFDDLGKAKPGAQNAEGDAWSFETFMTNWGKMSPDAKRTVFGGRGVDREIGDIVRYADRLRTLNKARNFSNTAGTAAQSGYVAAVVSSLFAGGPAAGASVASVYPAMNVVGRAFMATPALRAWTRSVLQAASRGNEGQARNLVRRLPSLAAKNPAISSEISQLEQRLLSAANDNFGRQVAASQEEKKTTKP